MTEVCVRCEKKLTRDEAIASYLCTDCYWAEVDEAQREAEEYEQWAYSQAQIQKAYEESQKKEES